jgi:hypothetical protein
MKLTNPETIQENEKDFIDTINAELDWEAIEKMLLEKHNFTLQEDIDYKDGDLVVYNDDIAYKFEFEIKVPLSVIFNREGECLKISTHRDDLEDEDDLEDAGDDPEEDIEDGLEDENLDTFEIDDGLEEGGDLEEDIDGLEENEAELEEEVDDLSVDEGSDASSMIQQQNDKVAKMASNIADKISEINQGDE